MKVGVERKNMRYLVYGTGRYSENFLRHSKDCMGDVIGFVETKKTKDMFRGKKVYDLDQIGMLEYDAIIVAALSDSDIRRELNNKGIDECNVVYLKNSWIPIRLDAGQVLTYDFLNAVTISCQEGVFFAFDGVYSNSSEAIKAIKGNVSASDYWINKEEFVSLNEVPMNAIKQMDFLKNHFIPNIEKEDILCDYACASGEWGRFLSDYACSIDGFDISESMIDKARQRAHEANLRNLSYYCLDAEKGLLEKKYDHFLMMGLLTCIESDNDASSIIQIVADALKKGGVVVTRDTLCTSGNKIYFYKGETNYYGIYRSIDDYKRLFEVNGLCVEIEEVFSEYHQTPIAVGSHGFLFRKS